MFSLQRMIPGVRVWYKHLEPDHVLILEHALRFFFEGFFKNRVLFGHRARALV